MHYKDFIGCSRNNRNLVPVHFKKPNSALIPPASQKVRIRGTSAEEDENASYSADQTSLRTGEFDPQLDTAGLSSGYLHPAQPQFDTKDTGSTTQLRNIEPCLEPEINFTNQPIEELDSQPAVGVRSDPAVSQLYSSNTEHYDTTSSSAVQQDNTDGPTVSLSHAQPPNHCSLDVASIVARCAQLEQENNELRDENLALEQRLVYSN